MPLRAAAGVVTRGKGVYDIGLNHGDKTEFEANNLADFERGKVLWVRKQHANY